MLTAASGQTGGDAQAGGDEAVLGVDLARSEAIDVNAAFGTLSLLRRRGGSGRVRARTRGTSEQGLGRSGRCRSRGRLTLAAGATTFIASFVLSRMPRKMVTRTHGVMILAMVAGSLAGRSVYLCAAPSSER
ncbi:MAG: hypothetical protein CYG60_19210 [Actinobacteria bacterium]|nr:hypothetical protein [Actinomycetota bacterium]PLS84193.1 MAG: hypothetical protein CYG60_19210 [Actinomycetota bacterium]